MGLVASRPVGPHKDYDKKWLSRTAEWFHKRLVDLMNAGGSQLWLRIDTVGDMSLCRSLNMDGDDYFRVRVRGLTHSLNI